MKRWSTPLLVLAAVMAGALHAGELERPEWRIGIVGDPAHRVDWNDETVGKLKAIGFNEVQINLAWGWRPFGEALNLFEIVTVPGEPEDPRVTARRAELQRRVALARKHGLRTLFHFGSPYTNRNPDTGDIPNNPNHLDDVTVSSWYDIENPKVRDHELALLKEFRRQFPQVDDILVYNYDQDAWQTPEYQYTRDSYGQPLDERLPAYLQALHEIWTQGRVGQAMMWWEPWELSAGQVYAMLPKLPRAGFGLMIHANIAEAQLALPVDGWFRLTARMCERLGLPVVAESFFASATEEIEPLSLPAPRLVDQEYAAFTHVAGIRGIKEYYGTNLSRPDLDTDLLAARLRNSGATTEELLAAITARFGPAQIDVRNYLNELSDALETYPWDASWFAREVGRASIDHGWHAATIRGASWPSPSWQSTRHARFMRTDNSQPHFWMLEDVELRCRLAADSADRAFALGARFLTTLSAADRAQFERIQTDLDHFRRVARSYALHLRETNVAQMLRQDQQAGRPVTDALVKELGQLLDADVENQRGVGRVLDVRALYRESPAEFVRRYLLPSATVLQSDPASRYLSPTTDVPSERGDFTLTTR